MGSADDRIPVRLLEAPSWLLAQVATHAGRVVGEAFAGVGGRRYHYALLAALVEFGPASQAALARRCGIDRSDVVAALNEMSAAGLVIRAPDSGDRRRNVITPTDEGRASLAQADAALATAHGALLDPLTEEERATLVRLLGRLVAS
ncbi:MarR family winged helix-turn-helix transcriptional regulator [Streptomyces sp. PT12]|uniref:MarR family winged helix-turn-helix transcriptional regulator n=1 Tax=Streptomyces sp. PT12 TaxID=1510197 RepID=UPI000DE2A115|nr:MarR family transcriptional regulator [Streptomyces sp. PT12]RBM05550.1 MarR family transcriptional regulator [Streptomyces sp. PT12]